MGLLPCPRPCQCHEEDQESHHSNNNHLHSSSSLSSSSLSSFLCSQPSLPSIPSLTTPSSTSHQQISAVHHRCLATLTGHTSHVFSLALSGDFLYSASSNSEIRSWSRHDGDDPSSISNSGSNVVASSNGAAKSLVVSGDKLLISAHQDHKIRVWKIDAANGNQNKFHCTATLPTLNDRVSRFFSARNYVQVRRHKKRTWVHHVDTVSALALSRDGSLLYSASWDRTFKVWRTSDFKCLESVWNAHDDAINALVLSNDGLLVYTGSADKKIKVWRRNETQKCSGHLLIATLERHRSAVNALALSADCSVLYSGACDRSILVWEKTKVDLSSGEIHMAVSGALRGHTRAILCLAVVSDLVCSGSAENTVRIWRGGGAEKSYACLAVFEGHGKPVKCLTAAIDQQNERGARDSDLDSGTSYLVYSGSLDCDIKVWRIWVPIL